MLILASASPRRQELLRNAGIEFLVDATDIPEIPQPGETPTDFVERLACEKAQDVARRHAAGYILGADTTVVADGQILNKPADADDATRMLRLLSGRTHRVITGVCLICSAANTRKQTVRSEATQVTFQTLSDADIQVYVSTGEPMDKAGAYGIQGLASRFIPRIEGDYFNVVGLPVALVWKMLQESGWRSA